MLFMVGTGLATVLGEIMALVDLDDILLTTKRIDDFLLKITIFENNSRIEDFTLSDDFFFHSRDLT